MTLPQILDFEHDVLLVSKPLAVPCSWEHRDRIEFAPFSLSLVVVAAAVSLTPCSLQIATFSRPWLFYLMGLKMLDHSEVADVTVAAGRVPLLDLLLSLILWWELFSLLASR